MAGISVFSKQLMSIKRAVNQESSEEISLKLDEKCSGAISSSSQIEFVQFLHYTGFFSAICPCSAHCTTMLHHACLFRARLNLIYL